MQCLIAETLSRDQAWTAVRHLACHYQGSAYSKAPSLEIESRMIQGVIVQSQAWRDKDEHSNEKTKRNTRLGNSIVASTIDSGIDLRIRSINSAA